MFEPIAIVGQACVLPGALNPDELWRLIREKRSALSPTNEHDWRIGAHADTARLAREAVGRVGGYVRGFERVFRADGFLLPAEEIRPLDSLFHFALHTAREALADAGIAIDGTPKRGGVVLGNLSYPNASLARFAEDVWTRGSSKVDPRNRFTSGLPAHLVARAIGFQERSFALDAACASSLYALRLACDMLHDGKADVMLAGGVCHVDDLILHLGFTALQAISKSGRSRPFHRDADGLVPAHGAALVVLRRLDDAERAGDRILGVIRAIGLANDGRSRGLLVPSEEGQIRALRAAYEMSGLSPNDVSLVECHATGTVTGDAVELATMREVFAGCTDVPIGSIKSNLGHPITASGAAALLKVLAAMKAGIRPATLHADEPTNGLADGPLRLLHDEEPWPVRAGRPRVAAISNFGFGGNNAHLLVEEWIPRAAKRTTPNAPARPAVIPTQIAIIAQAVFTGTAQSASVPPFVLPVDGLRLPPSDLSQTLPQQLLVLRAALDVKETIARAAPERTMLLVGMQCDAEVARNGAAWRVPLSDESGGDARGCEPLSAATVLGCMPNVVANRVSQQLDLRGPCFTIASEEASGTVALEVAMRALRHGEVDTAVVGAVDLCCEPVHTHAAATPDGDGHKAPGDAAVLMVLKRLEDAQRDADEIIAVVGDEEDVRATPVGAARGLGHAHAASGLLAVSEAALAVRHGVRHGADGSPVPWLPEDGRRVAAVNVTALGGQSTRTIVRSEGGARSPRVASGPRLLCVSASSVDGLARQLTERDGDAPNGYLRLAITAASDPQLEERIIRARGLLASPHLNGEKGSQKGLRELAAGIWFSDAPVGGELAFVFTGPAGAYPMMGRDLAVAFPELVDRVASRSPSLDESVGWIYDVRHDETLTPRQKLWGASFLCQLHAELSLRLLRLEPRAAIGYCSGESNALFALGAWRDWDGLRTALDDAGIFSRELGGELRAVRRAWGSDERDEISWGSLRILAAVEDVRAALEGEPRAHLTIINGARDVVIAGDAVACERVANRIGRQRTRSLDYDFVMHCPEASEVRDLWRALHRRETKAVPGVRFYTHATCSSYEASSDSAADAAVGQAMGLVDFPKLIEQAYADGVRVFLEHGPRAGCSKWISAALGVRPHLAIALDEFDRSSLTQAVDATARLYCAGVGIDVAGLSARLSPPAADRPTGRIAMVETHWPPPIPLAEVVHATVHDDADAVLMPLPPALPSVRFVPTPRVAAPHALAAQVSTIERIAALNASIAEVHRAYLREHSESHTRAMALAAAPIAWLQRAIALPPSPTSSPINRYEPSVESPAVGPRLDRDGLIAHARGKISSVFGPLFERQDGYARQVRMPEPPLLLADRVTRLEGVAGGMGTGVVVTETDVTPNAWYLHETRMPAGIMIEAGQADLLLISWLGADFENRGERVYRLLGCDLRSFGELPKAGDTLEYEIHVDGHANQGDIRLFFFHYDCRRNGELVMNVRNGQAGFFTDEELAQSSGVLWSADDEPPSPNARVDGPIVQCSRHALSADDVTAFAEGRVLDCFGRGFERTASHTRTPTIPAGRMRLLDDVSVLDPRGSPWQRGYLRARLALRPDHWFFAGHFKNDPCMPGTLMLEGCLEAMAIYMTSLGFTLERDGWRFEPVPETDYSLRCRGQATPASKDVVYEIFVDEVIAGPIPTLYADVLGSVDGLKAFHCRRLGLRLVPAWPLDEGRVAPDQPRIQTGSQARVARVNGFAFDHESLLACALGRPTSAFGDLYRAFDGARRVARLPGPPYHFMSRITSIEGPIGGMREGSRVEVEYDVPPDAWYFAENGAPVMPLCVLMEATLQPCGWLASYVGCALQSENDLVFRNLDGAGVVLGQVGRDAGVLTGEVTLTSLSIAGPLVLVAFDATLSCRGARLFSVKTSFGFFPPDSMKSQSGLPTTDEDRARLLADSLLPVPELRDPPRTATGKLALLDRVTGLWPRGGAAGLGRIRAEMDVRPDAWFFRAHFFQDPVQPGSLGVEAMLAALEILQREQGDAVGAERTFEAAALGRRIEWKYRGQVVPENRVVVIDVEITALGVDGEAVGRGWLWVDGLRIYEVDGLSARLSGRA